VGCKCDGATARRCQLFPDTRVASASSSATRSAAACSCCESQNRVACFVELIAPVGLTRLRMSSVAGTGCLLRMSNKMHGATGRPSAIRPTRFTAPPQLRGSGPSRGLGAEGTRRVMRSVLPHCANGLSSSGMRRCERLRKSRTINRVAICPSHGVQDNRRFDPSAGLPAGPRMAVDPLPVARWSMTCRSTLLVSQ
jgi:hypothetical protein